MLAPMRNATNGISGRYVVHRPARPVLPPRQSARSLEFTRWRVLSKVRDHVACCGGDGVLPAGIAELS